MTKCTQESFNFPDVKKRTVEVNFESGEIASDGGVMLLRQVNKRSGRDNGLCPLPLPHHWTCSFSFANTPYSASGG